MSEQVGTDLYRRILAFDYGDVERADLMSKVWSVTPWMADAYTGSCGEQRERQMIEWCCERCGWQASPIHDIPGSWQRGSATVYGWTWFGFADEADLIAFLEAWPTPAGIEHPQ